MSDDKYLSKISKLLVQAERASTEAEATAYMQAAQKLATTTQIDLAVARAHVAKKERRSPMLATSVTLGRPRQRLLHTYVELFLAIGRANDVTCDVAKDSTFIYPYGYEDDIELVKQLYSSLVVQMVTACDAYLRSDERKAETVHRSIYRTDEWGDRRYVGETRRPMHGITARRCFQQAFASRIGTRLREARNQAIAEARAAEMAAFTEDERRNFEANAAESKTGTELALIEKSVEIHDFYKSHSTASGSYRGGRSSRDYAGGAAAAGHAAGNRARLGGEKALAG